MNKFCRDCRFFTNEDVNGYGWCSRVLTRTRSGSGICREYEMPNNGWTEITPDNVEGLYDVDPCSLMIATIDSHGNPQYAKYDGMSTTLDAMATIGGCYSFVLPELRLEDWL